MGPFEVSSFSTMAIYNLFNRQGVLLAVTLVMPVESYSSELSGRTMLTLHCASFSWSQTFSGM